MEKHLHILGICGTFMGGIAALATQLGYRVTGSDQHVYAPMSEMLESLNIDLLEGYDPSHLKPRPDLVLVGNSISRGNPELEAVLDARIVYQSGPQWLFEQILEKRHVLAIAGTHGKTTTTAMLAWILADAGLSPGYLIGGAANDFERTADLGAGEYFVIEADEYDSCFFDKRPKFMHYRPQTLVINNLEFDHADIFPNLAAIQRQFHYLLRTVPQSGLVIHPYPAGALDAVFDQGCWSQSMTFGLSEVPTWSAHLHRDDGSSFSVAFQQDVVARVEWSMIGAHNVSNALAAIAAAHNVGVAPSQSAKALGCFQGVRRRLQVRGTARNVTVYDDFAHHPTAIKAALDALRAKVGNERITAIVEFASATMRMGVHQSELASAFQAADQVIFLQPNWNIDPVVSALKSGAVVLPTVPDILAQCEKSLHPHEHVLIMSNRSFDGIHQKLLDRLNKTGV